MPQLDISTYSSQIFWLLVCLVALFFALKYIFIPKLETSIQARHKYIDNLLQNAETMRLETIILNQEYSDEIKKAYLKVAEVHKKTIEDFETKCAERLELLASEQRIKTEQMQKAIDKAKKDFAVDIEKKSQVLLDQFLLKIFSSTKLQKKSN